MMDSMMRQGYMKQLKTLIRKMQALIDAEEQGKTPDEMTTVEDVGEASEGLMGESPMAGTSSVDDLDDDIREFLQPKPKKAEVGVLSIQGIGIKPKKKEDEHQPMHQQQAQKKGNWFKGR